MPAVGKDDVRDILPAIAADVAAELAAPFEQLSEQLSTLGDQFSKAVKGVDFGVAAIPDLTKIIPKIGSNALDAFGGAGAAVSGALAGANPLDAFIPTSGSPFADAFGDYTGSAALTNATDNIREFQAESAVNSVAARVSSAVNTTANQGVSAVSDAAQAKARSLLGGT